MADPQIYKWYVLIVLSTIYTEYIETQRLHELPEGLDKHRNMHKMGDVNV